MLCRLFAYDVLVGGTSRWSNAAISPERTGKTGTWYIPTEQAALLPSVKTRADNYWPSCWDAKILNITNFVGPQKWTPPPGLTHDWRSKNRMALESTNFIHHGRMWTIGGLSRLVYNWLATGVTNQGYYPSGYVKIAIEHGPVEIVALPFKKMGIFQFAMLNYQRVTPY